MLKKSLLIASYVLVAAVIAIGTLLLVSYGQGYSYDFSQHKFVTNGLLILDTIPGSAQIRINGKLLKRQTPYRTTLRVGQYDVKIHKDGYRDWSKRVTIVTSEVVNLANIILVPDKLKTSTIASSKEATTLLASSDRRHVAYITTGSQPGLWRMAADRTDSFRVFTPTAGQQITGGALSRDGSRAVLRVQQADGLHQIYVDMGAATHKDLTTELKTGFDDLRFSFNDANRLYWMSPEGLRLVDVNAKTVSGVLADKVASYTFDGDRIIYVQSTKVGKTISVMDGDGKNAKALVEGVAESPSYQLSVMSYRGKDYLAVVPASNQQLTVYEGIYTDNVIARVVARNVTRLIASDDGHYVVFGRANGFGSYDTGRAKIYDGLYNGSFDSISWFNGAHVIVNAGGQTRLVEFDGGNSTDIAASISSPSVGMHDQRRIVYIDSATKQVVVADLRK